MRHSAFSLPQRIQIQVKEAHWSPFPKCGFCKMIKNEIAACPLDNQPALEDILVCRPVPLARPVRVPV